jgi:hypothetical protein
MRYAHNPGYLSAHCCAASALILKAIRFFDLLRTSFICPNAPRPPLSAARRVTTNSRLLLRADSAVHVEQ